MPSNILSVSFDCRDPYRLAQFWAAVTGFIEHPDFPNEPGEPEAALIDPKGLQAELLFLVVPEGKVVKNRIHLDLRPDILRDDEVERLLGLGATMIDDRRQPDGAGWAVLGDPEGNELCVCRSAAERDDVPVPVDHGLRHFPLVRQAEERATLLELSDWYRTGVVGKVDGLAPRHAIATPLRSATSIAGLIKHLAIDEDSWFSVRFAGNEPLDWYAHVDWDADPDWEFHTALDEPLELQVRRYQEACENTRRIIAEHDLDDLSVAQQGTSREPGPFTLRFAVTHMLEETARHLGHLDILRELLDGTTGE